MKMSPALIPAPLDPKLEERPQQEWLGVPALPAIYQRTVRAPDFGVLHSRPVCDCAPGGGVFRMESGIDAVSRARDRQDLEMIASCWWEDVALVEDHQRLATLLTKALRNAGIETDVFERIEPALLAATQHAYAVLVIDRGLPDGDG